MEKPDYYKGVIDLSRETTITKISVRDIANQLNVSTGALYYLFKNKNQLINEMFLYYKANLNSYLREHSQSTEELLKNYLAYNIEKNLEFRFMYSSELDHLLTKETLAKSLEFHLEFLEMIGLDFERDAHITTIILGTMRSYLSAPDYMQRCDIDKLIGELNQIIRSYKLVKE